MIGFGFWDYKEAKPKVKDRVWNDHEPNIYSNFYQARV